MVPEKRSLSNDVVLTREMLYNQADLETTQFSKFSKRPGLRRRNIFECRVVNNWSRLPHTVKSVTEQHELKKNYKTHTYSAFANSCPLQTDTFLFPLIHSHNVLPSSNKFYSCNERLGR